MELTFRVRYILQILVETYCTLFTIYMIYVYICEPILLKTYLRRDTRPCQRVERILGVNIEIVTEQLFFSAIKSTSRNIIN